MVNTFNHITPTSSDLLKDENFLMKRVSEQIVEMQKLELKVGRDSEYYKSAKTQFLYFSTILDNL